MISNMAETLNTNGLSVTQALTTTGEPSMDVSNAGFSTAPEIVPEVQEKDAVYLDSLSVASCVPPVNDKAEILLTRHPLSAAFPSMHQLDHLALTADIRRRGQLNNISLFQGMVLDGWHRYKSCLELGIAPVFSWLPDGTDPIAFVISGNLLRRNLNGTQRAAAVLGCHDWAQVGANQHEGCKQGLQATASEMAREARVSRQTIQQVKLAFSVGLGDYIRDGKLSVNRISEIIKLPKDQWASAMANPDFMKKAKKPRTKPELSESDMVAIRNEMLFSPEKHTAYSEMMQAQLDDADKNLVSLANENKVLTEQIYLLKASLKEMADRGNEAISLVNSNNPSCEPVKWLYWLRIFKRGFKL